jgi:DNA segregation ATPase FtsK/SpoIIIE, S-DNA-T family
MVRSQPQRRQPDPWAEWIEQSLLPITIFAGYLVWWAVLFPMFSVPIIVSLGLLITGHGWAALVLTLAQTLLLAGWACLYPDGWKAAVTDRFTPRWRHCTYTLRWPKICALHGLSTRLDEKVLVPKLRRIVVSATSDMLEVGMLAGHTVDHWHQQSDALAHAFRARAARVRHLRPGVITIQLLRDDPLQQVIVLPTPQTPVDLTAITIGRQETGQPWRVPVLYRHLLVVGATGAGKGSVIWSVLTGLAPAIRDGLVSVRVVDPKGGMELGAGAPLFDDFAHNAGESMLNLLRTTVDVMQARGDHLRGKTRLHVPTVEEPLIVVIVDELATITAYGTDRRAKAEAEQLLGLLLSQGRAVGVTVIGAIQDPSKEVMAMRQLFPIRIGLRLVEQSQIAMVFGIGARDRGARCDEIPDSLPGVGYGEEDGSAEVIRVRAFHVPDDAVDHLVATYRCTRGATK